MAENSARRIPEGVTVTPEPKDPVDLTSAAGKTVPERKAEHLLADLGVYAGHHGLRGLAEAQDFWDEQPYGKRLYYGAGNLDYLHLDVLRAAVRALDEAALALVAAPTAAQGEWMPIESAPKDGMNYVLVAHSRGVWLAHYAPVAASGFRFDQPWRSVMLNHNHIAHTARCLPPTHWMQLPEPPPERSRPCDGHGVSAAPTRHAVASPLQQVTTGIAALNVGHDALCMAVLRGKACTCGVGSSSNDQQEKPHGS